MSLEPSYTGTEIAIVGMALRVPGAQDLDTFWRNLRDGVESIGRFSAEEARAAGAPEDWLDDPRHVRAGGMLADMDRFDAGFFGFSPREAEILDPQQRHFLELAWEALEAAGYDPDRLQGAVGVFAGAAVPSYLLGNLSPREDVVASVGHFPLMIANDKDFLATRVAYKLNLRGPCVTVQTACSTSLVAVHMACQSLLNGECDMALAGGVAINVRQQAGYLFQEGGIGSPDGHCRAFDAAARGTVGGSGAGLVALKRLEDAIKDGDTIHAVLKGTAINNDGAGKVGFTAPSVEGQARVVAEAIAIADVPAESIGYMEAHGTGTTVGDPIEIAALTQAHRRFTEATGYCAIGSVKTNLGHLDIAAGIVGLIKAALTVKHGLIPPSLHFERPNPQIDFARSPFFVAGRPTEWPVPGHPRRAGVSAFGIGGTNAHAILEEYRPAPLAPGGTEPVVLPLSARTPEALDAAAARLATHLRAHPVALADVAYTLTEGRKPFECRRTVVAADPEEAARLLEQPAVYEAGRPAVAFLIPGQGAQHPHMARRLYEAEPGFRNEVDRACEILRPVLGRDLRELLFPAAGQESQAAEALAQTALTQPALFVVGYAAARWLRERGVQPTAMIGHSVGEYVAACLAGVFTLEDALTLVAARGRLVQALPTGRMLSVQAAPDVVQPLLPAGTAIAATNAPGLCVVSGPEPAIADLAERLEAAGVAAKPLVTSHAFHSPMMDPAVAELARLVAAVPRLAPQLAFVSNVTGTWITAEEATDPAYWARHLREPVRFADGLATLLTRPGTALVEVGPGAGLARLARLQARPDTPVLHLLPAVDRPEDDRRHALDALGRLWAIGVPVAWPTPAGRRVPLPTYPFERRRYWIDPPREPVVRPTGPAREVKDWGHALNWRQAPAAASAWPAGEWLVVGAPAIAESLSQRGLPVVTADALPETLGPTTAHVVWAAPADGAFEALDAFLRALPARDSSLTVVAPQLWNVTGGDPVKPDLALLLGLTRVAPLELAGLRVRVVDPGTTAIDRWLPELAEAAPAEVAYRHGRRWWPGWDAVPLHDAPTPVFREGGVYLVTGGLGALGLALAEHLAERHRARLVLVGRNQLTPERRARVQALEATGAEVLVLTADVTDGGAIARVITEAEARFGALHGVFHLAGVAGGGLLRFREPGASRAIRAPKVDGLRALASALGDRPLEVFAVFSSVNAVVGTPGQADYAAANAYLDAFAQSRPAWPVVSVAFGPWREIGMAVHAEVPAELRAFRDEALRHGMRTRDGLLALERAIATRLPHVVVSPMGPEALTAAAARWQERLSLETVVPAARHARPALKTELVPPRTEMERAIAAIWQELLGLDEVGVHDNFFELGGHSLAAVSLLARLEKLVGRKLAVEKLLQGGTIAALATLLEAEAAPEGETLPAVLVPIQPNGTRPPLFLVHPSGGTVLCYGELARALGPDQPLYGFVAPGILGETPLSDVPTMAERYLTALRTVRPEGPYRLGGWSFGGVVAFEMARRLRAAGAGVEPVVVIDNMAPVPANKPETLDGAQVLLMFLEDLGAMTGVSLPLDRDRLALLGPEAGLEQVLDQAQAAGVLEPLGGAAEIRRRFAVFAAHIAAMLAFAPGADDGAVHLLRASERGGLSDPGLGWGEIAGHLAVTEVPGNHYTVLTRPGVEAVAAAFQGLQAPGR